MMIRRQALLTLLGVMLIKIATGIISLWGSLNLYILSYFNYYGTKIIPLTNSMIVLSIIIPTSILILWATKISKKFGYQKTVRICAIIFMLAPQLINFSFTLITFSIFCVFIPACTFAISSIPVINCLWTQFSEVKHKATAIAVFSFGLGAIIWNYFFTMKVNPNNQEATIMNQSGMLFFGEEVIKNVYDTIRYGYIICGSLFVVGSWLIKKNQEQIQMDFQQYPSEKFQKTNSIQQTGAIQLPPPNEIYKTVRESIRSSKQNNELSLNLKTSEKTSSLVYSLKDRRFLYIFLISMLSGLYQIYIHLNIKLIYMPIINNDHFLVYCAIISYAVAIFGAFFWGFLGDKKGIHTSLLIFTTLDLIIKIYGCFAKTQFSILIMFILLGLSDKGMMTMMGPGLVQIFGIQTATQLLPYKGISIFMGFLAVPIFYIILSSWVSSLQFLYFLLLFNIICVVLAYKLYRIK